MRDHLRRRRVDEEVLLLASFFGEVNYDERHGRWVMLPRFPLPPRLGRPSCALLIKLPLFYPAIPPFGVYIDRDLPLREHYFPDADLHNLHAEDGWAWLCLHQASDDSSAWRPGASVRGGDNLLVLLVLVRALLEDARV